MKDTEQSISAARHPRKREVVAARIADALKTMTVDPPTEGVLPLNVGYFTLEKIRTESVAKKRNDVRAKLKG